MKEKYYLVSSFLVSVFRGFATDLAQLTGLS